MARKLEYRNATATPIYKCKTCDSAFKQPDRFEEHKEDCE